MAFTYLLYIAFFGAATVVFLWLRDARIFFRTGLPGYRRASYQGIICTALALAGVGIALAGNEILGLAIPYLAMILQGRIEKEKVWTRDSGVAERLFGKVDRNKITTAGIKEGNH